MLPASNCAATSRSILALERLFAAAAALAMALRSFALSAASFAYCAFWAASAALAAFSSFTSFALAFSSSARRRSSFCFWTAVSWRRALVWSRVAPTVWWSASSVSRSSRDLLGERPVLLAASSCGAHLGEHVRERGARQERLEHARCARRRRRAGCARRARPCARRSSARLAASSVLDARELAVQVVELVDEARRSPPVTAAMSSTIAVTCLRVAGQVVGDALELGPSSWRCAPGGRPASC